MNKFVHSTLLASTVAIMWALSLPAHAITFLLGETTANSLTPPPFASVTLVQNGSNVDVTVQLCTAGNPHCAAVPALAGQLLEEFGFNIADGSTFSPADIVGEPSNFDVNTSANLSQFGTFDYSLFKSGGNNSDGVNPLIFTVENALISDLTTDVSGGGQAFAGTLFAVKVSSSGGGSFVGLAPVPLPASAWLFLSAIGALVALRRRHNVQPAVPTALAAA